MIAPSACSLCSTSSRAGAWRSSLRDGFDPTMCSSVSLISSSPTVHPSTLGQTTARSSSRSTCATGGVKTLYIEPGSPWENGYCESLNSKLRDELLKGEIFTTLREAQVLIENWRRHYNAVRPHSSLRYRPPAPEAILPPASGLP